MEIKNHHLNSGKNKGNLLRSVDSKRGSKGKKRVFLLAMEIKPLPSMGNVKLQWRKNWER